jgi:8-oxo-dGTP pyrophosphatase MutT (NUDIX family)
MLLDDRPDLHVLMLRRRAGSAFVGGMMVFPGGGVDTEDAAPEVDAVCAGLDDAAASERLGLPRGGLAYWVATIRESFEEAGVLLARDRTTGRPVDFSEAEAERRFAAHRVEVDASRARLADVVRSEGLELVPADMHYTARWITPLGPPRRYDTRFFVTVMPPGQTPVHDDREAVHSEWVRPVDAIARFAAGELAMLPPTLGMLRILAGYEKAEAVMQAAAAHEDGPDRPARLAVEGDLWRVVLPGDEDYEDASRGDLNAWVRLPAHGDSPAPVR